MMNPMKVNLHYPSLLEEDKEINFYLKFRQFIELIAGTGTKTILSISIK